MSIKQKLSIMPILKVCAYALSMPLFILLTLHSAVKLNYGIFEGKVDLFIPLIITVVAFVVVIGAQVAVGFTMKKASLSIKIAVIATVGFVVVLAPFLYTDTILRNKVNGMKDDYQSNSFLNIRNFENLYHDYKEDLEEINLAYKAFIDDYGLAGDEGDNKNKDSNNSNRTPSGTKSDMKNNFLDNERLYIFGNGVGGMEYGMNGLPAEGWVFGFEDAGFVISTYYESKKAVEASATASQKTRATNLGISVADVVLSDALTALRTGNTAWIQYQNSAEYKRVYGAQPLTGKTTIGGKEYDEYWMHESHYTITRAELEVIVLEVIKLLFGPNRYPDNSFTIANYWGVLIDLAIEFNIVPEEFSDIIEAINKNSTLDSILAALPDGMEEMLFDLLDEFVGYQSPSTLPIIAFLSNDTLKDYAYAQYIAQKHGGNIGAVLIPVVDGGRVGRITMDSNGKEAWNTQELLDLFVAVEVFNNEFVKIFPWLAAREIMLYCFGIVPLMLLLAYVFADKERKLIKEIENASQKGGK
ncbi:MAG: hypothetical protein FWD49_06465 [Firmicutes bacterium]|nr:hypothetical protein [Bacillota bacterium]